MNCTMRLLAASGALVAAFAFLRMETCSALEQVETPPVARNADEAAVRQTTAAFVKAVEKGDAKAVAAFWTPEGEYIDDDGTVIRGRAAIEQAYAAAFAAKRTTKVEMKIESIRFPSKDTAIEEGHAQSFKGDLDQATSTRYSVLHVREGGNWLMAMLREWPAEGASLRDLEWLIGTWQAKTDEADVRTTYSWNDKKTAIHCQISIKSKGRTIAAQQVLLKDPRSGHIHSWMFDDEGGFGEAIWARDGKRWVLTATGVQADGGELTATNIMTPVDKDTFIWQSTERTLDGEELANIPPIKVTRVK